MSGRPRGVPLPREVALALREFVNALGKATMYPAGHRFVLDAASALALRLAEVAEQRGAMTLGILPTGLLLDGGPVEPLPPVLREFAARLHRKNIGTIHVGAGIAAPEVAEMLAALVAPDVAEAAGRTGWRGHAVRVEPLVYDVLAFGDNIFDQELDEAFWAQLVEAAFGRQLSELEGTPTPAQLAEAITERAARNPAEARRIFEALASFSSAIASRGDRGTGGARKRFTEVLAALSRPTQVRVVQGASSAVARRRFVADTIQVVPTALLLQLLEAVAEADGAPISAQLRWLLGKLAVGGDGVTEATPAFVAQVLSLVDQWEGLEIDETAHAEPRVTGEPLRLLTLGLEIGSSAPSVRAAAVAMADHGHLAEVLRLLDAPDNDAGTVQAITDSVMDPGLLQRLLAAPDPDFALIERVVRRTRVAAVPVLLHALEVADNRSARRRLLDLLVHVGPEIQPLLVARLDGAPWYLARNILGVLAHLPELPDPQPVLRAARHSDPRVRQEAFKVLVRHPETRDRAIQEALEQGDAGQTRLALTVLGGQCPPSLIAPVLSVLGHPEPELRLQAVRLLTDATSPLVVPPLLTLVRTRGGLFRRLRLLAPTPPMLAALEILARRWQNHRPVVAVLQLAMKSGDPQIRAAAGGAP